MRGGIPQTAGAGFSAEFHARGMDHEACFQLSSRGDGRVADRNTANGVALALNLFASLAANRSGYARTENQIVVRGVYDGVRVHLGQVALLNDDSFCKRFHGEFSSFSGPARPFSQRLFAASNRRRRGPLCGPGAPLARTAAARNWDDTSRRAFDANI